ncbi:MAG: hypothetical protein WDN03_16280 [Rhizomicrobium sp.]
MRSRKRHAAINAGKILFTGGAIATKAAQITTSVPAVLAADTTVMLPAGTQTSQGTLGAPTAIVIPLERH